MFCPTCQRPARRFGRNRNGSQRYRCNTSARTFTDEETRPADRRRLAADLAVGCLRMLLEGMSLRSTERLTGVHRDTVMRAMVDAGQTCQRFLETAVRAVAVADVQADEIWAFIPGCVPDRHRLRAAGQGLCRP